MDRRIRTIFIIFFLWWPHQSMSQQAQELFLLANKAYEKGESAEALRHYQAIKKKGPILWYNMGNCYYRQHDFAQAIACWQRALRGATVSLYKDVEHNCAHAYQKLSKKYHSSWWDMIMASSAYRIPILVMQLLFLLCWALLFMMIMRRQKSWHNYFSIIGLLLLLFYFGLVLWYHYQQQRQAYGIVIEKTAPLYVGPDAQYHAVGTAEIGDRITLMQKRAAWYKVSKDGTTGWIPSSAIEIVEQLS